MQLTSSVRIVTSILGWVVRSGVRVVGIHEKVPAVRRHEAIVMRLMEGRRRLVAVIAHGRVERRRVHWRYLTLIHMRVRMLVLDVGRRLAILWLKSLSWWLVLELMLLHVELRAVQVVVILPVVHADLAIRSLLLWLLLDIVDTALGSEAALKLHLQAAQKSSSLLFIESEDVIHLIEFVLLLDLAQRASDAWLMSHAASLQPKVRRVELWPVQ